MCVHPLIRTFPCRRRLAFAEHLSWRFGLGMDLCMISEQSFPATLPNPWRSSAGFPSGGCAWRPLKAAMRSFETDSPARA